MLIANVSLSLYLINANTSVTAAALHALPQQPLCQDMDVMPFSKEEVTKQNVEIKEECHYYVIAGKVIPRIFLID